MATQKNVKQISSQPEQVRKQYGRISAQEYGALTGKHATSRKRTAKKATTK